MAKGTSGRIVIDVDPAFKDEVYLALALQKSISRTGLSGRLGSFVMNSASRCF